MMLKVRRIIGLEYRFQDGLKQYNIVSSRINTMNDQINVLATEYAGVTNSFSKAITNFPERAKVFNERYNTFFSEYIEDVAKLKKAVDADKKALEEIIKATPFLKSHIQTIKRVSEDGYKFVFADYMHDNLGVLREDMPQYSYKSIEKLVERLADENLTINKVSLPVDILKPTQQDIDRDKVCEIVDKGMKDKHFMPIISKDLHILDGHHHWASILEVDKDEIVDAYMVNVPMSELLQRVKNHNDLEKAAKFILEFAHIQGVISDEAHDKIEKLSGHQQ